MQIHLRRKNASSPPNFSNEDIYGSSPWDKEAEQREKEIMKHCNESVYTQVLQDEAGKGA
jgi:hypothetical protein